MKKDPHVFLLHALDSITWIETYTAKMRKEYFLSHPLIQDAVIRNLEVIGEAVKYMPSSFKAKHPSVPWKDIAGMRDVLIHEYFGVDKELVWETVKKDIPKLKRFLSRVLLDDPRG